MSLSKAPKLPPNRGRIIIEHDNTETLRFWIRVFELEPQIAFAQAKFHEHSAAAPDKEHDPVWGMVPIISEYNAGSIKWIYAVVIELDTLGVCGGTGIIYFADKANEKEAYEHRDRFADMVIDQAKERAKSGAMVEVHVAEPGAQE